MKIANLHLSDLPTECEIAAGIEWMLANDPRTFNHAGVTANMLAAHLGVEKARRGGKGAMKGSWSGYMAPGLRLAPRLGSMMRRGLLTAYYEDYRRRYYLTLTGEQTLL